jgi:hypothetical protein
MNQELVKFVKNVIENFKKYNDLTDFLECYSYVGREIGTDEAFELFYKVNKNLLKGEN